MCQAFKLEAKYPAEWTERWTFEWHGMADNGTLILFLNGKEVERYDGLNMDALCDICGEKLAGDCVLRIIDDEPRLVCSHHTP